MIPLAHIQEWSAVAPWPDSRQIEQDLIISRALCDLFNAPALAGAVAFRGGTAIHKLLFDRPLRYSEDIDLGSQFSTNSAARQCWRGFSSLGLRTFKRRSQQDGFLVIQRVNAAYFGAVCFQDWGAVGTGEENVR